MITVRFARQRPPYNEGETAGFPDAEARRLIEAGIAAPVVVVKPEPAGTVTKNVPARKRRGRTDEKTASSC